MIKMLCSKDWSVWCIPQVIVESDSKVLIDVVPDNFKYSGSIPTLVRHIHNLLDLKRWVQFCFTKRECNCCADWLWMCRTKLQVMETQCNKLHRLLFNDIFRASIPTSIRVISYFNVWHLVLFCTKKKKVVKITISGNKLRISHSKSTYANK